MAFITQAAGILEERPRKNEEEEKDTEALLLKAYLNMAVCLVKTKHSGRAISYCKRCLEIDRNNAKAMYLQGKVTPTCIHGVLKPFFSVFVYILGVSDIPLELILS